MRILVMGGGGQLGRALQGVATGHEITAASRSELDVADRAMVTACLEAMGPDIIINAAAYSHVDGCVQDYAAAYRSNGFGPQVLAVECCRRGIPLVHVSTNEVFDGRREGGYEEWMPIQPINPYGASKAAGEFAVRSLLPMHYIVRTAWLFAPGGRNFVHTILKRARAQGRLQVVTDEIGNPTSATDLAEAILSLIETGQYGTYHLTNTGACSRWDFANEILRAGGITNVENEGILSKEFERASSPPLNGVLLNMNGAALGIELRSWQEALRQFIREESPDLV